MSVSSVRRFAVLLAVAVVSFLIYAYQGPAQTSPVKPKEAGVKPSPREIQMRQDVFCEEGNKSMSRPLICIDDQTGEAVPRSTRIHDVEASREGKSTEREVIVHWFTKRSANLQLQYKSADCSALSKPDCDGRGHCEARVKVILEKGQEKKCTYGITAGALKDPDADIIIQPCCW